MTKSVKFINFLFCFHKYFANLTKPDHVITFKETLKQDNDRNQV